MSACHIYTACRKSPTIVSLFRKCLIRKWSDPRERTPLESRSAGNTESLSSLIRGSMSLEKIPSFFLFFSLKKREQVLGSGSRIYFSGPG